MSPRFRYYGHSTVSFDLPGGELVLIDPYLAENPVCPPASRDLPRLDAMLITHAHIDHFADAVELGKKHRPSTIVANYEICSWLESQGLVEETSPMGIGGSQQVLGCKVTMVRADHSAGLEDGDRMIYGGTAAGYVVRLPDGFTFYHAGDTALFGDMKLIGQIYKPDLAFLPVGDRFTMGPKEAAWACRLLEPKQVVPIHWGTFSFLTGRPRDFERELAGLGIDCEVLVVQPGEEFTPG